MKRFLIPLLLFASIAIADNVFDQEKIRNDFKNSNTDPYKNDYLKNIAKSEMILKHLDPQDIQNHQITCENNNFTNINDYRCPKAKEGFSTSILKSNLKSGNMVCLFAKKGVLEKPIATFNWSLRDYTGYNNSCDNLLVKDRAAAIAANSDAIEKSKEDFKALEAAKVQFSQASDEEGNNVAIPHLLASVLIQDGDLIDIQSSINHGSIVLQDGFNMKGANYLRAKNLTQTSIENANIGDVFSVSFDEAGGAGNWIKNLTNAVLANASRNTGIGDYNPQILVKKLENIASENNSKTSDLINHRLISLLEFYPKWTLLNQDFFILLMALFGGGAASFLIFSKGVNFVEKTQENTSLIMYISIILISFIMFLPYSENEQVEIDEKTYKTYNNNFQNLETGLYYTFIDFADRIAKNIIDTEMNSIIKRTNHVSTNSLISTFEQNEVFFKEAQIVGKLLHKCGNEYDIDLIQAQLDNKNNYFPSSEQMMYASYISKGRSPNYYSTHGNGGSVIFDNQEMYPNLSLSMCHSIANRYDFLEKRVNANDSLIAKAAAGVDSQKLQMIENIIKSQYGMYEEWGFMSILALPTIIYKSQQVGGLFEKEKLDYASQLLDNEKDTIVKDIAYNSPMLLIPGVSNLYQILKDNSGKIGASLGAVGGPKGSLTGGVVGFFTSSSIAYVGTVYFVEEIIKAIPIIGIVMFGLLILLKIIIKIFTYHLIAPFVLVIAFSKRNTEMITNFFSRVISIMLEIPIFVLSVFAAMAAHDILMSIGTPLSSTLMKIISEITIDSFGNDFAVLQHGMDYAMQGFVNILLNLFSFVIIFKILSTYHTQIFEALETKAATAFDDVIEKMQQSAQGWGHRI